MKKLLSFAFALATFTLLISACGNADKKTETTTNTQSETPAITAENATYACPMKCEKGFSDKPGKCGSCDMDLVMVEKKDATDMPHEHVEGDTSHKH